MQPDIQALDRQYIAGTYRRFPAVLRHGKGSRNGGRNGMARRTRFSR